MKRIDLPAAAAFLNACFPRGGRMLCAVSGGLDSMCLLDYAVRLPGFTAAAAHFHHGLRGAEADRDEAFVRAWCAEHGIPFVCGRGDTRETARREGLSIEEAARRLRYDFLEHAAAEGGYDAVLTAHHAEDNAETVLLNLIRGTGIDGLAGIPPVRGRFYRPFLQISKAELTAYAAARGLGHVEDSTNADPDAAARNALRSAVLPVLRQLNPRYAQHIARTSELLRGERQVLEKAARAVLSEAEPIPDGVCISWASLCRPAEATAQRAVLDLLEQVGGRRRDLSSAHVAAVLALKEGGEVFLPYGMTAQRQRERLEIVRRGAQSGEAALVPGGQVEFGQWQISARREPFSGGLALALPAGAALLVTAWRSGDRVFPPGSRGARTFKRACADRGLTPAQRDALPVVRVDGGHAADPEFGVSKEYAPQKKEETVFIRFYKKAEESEYEKRDGAGYSEGFGI